MYHVNQPKAKIYSTGIHLPKQVVTSEEIFTEIQSERQYDIATDWMKNTMGIAERRMAPHGTQPSDLALPAARQAIEQLNGIDPAHIDLLIFCGIERDQPEPATAHTIQNQLGLNAKYAFDLANACFGFVESMQIASNYIGAGIARYALIVTGEVPTRVTRAAVELLKRGVTKEVARKVIGALSVGDAGGAVVMGPTDQGGFELFNTISHSKLVDKCIYRQREDGSIDGHMIMGQMASAFIRLHQQLIDDTLSKLGWQNFDWMLSHQIGQRPFERLTRLTGTQPSRMVKTLDKFGNITSATFPVNFYKLSTEQNVKQGEHIGGCFAGSGAVVGQLGYTF